MFYKKLEEGLDNIKKEVQRMVLELELTITE